MPAFISHVPHASQKGRPAAGGGTVPLTTGNVFFVDSGHASAADHPSHGKSADYPFATIDYAVGQCTASNGDVIYVMPGHTEDIAAAGGIDLDVAGITLIGIGNGSNRPTITYSATASDIDIDAANITVENFLIDMTGVDAVVAGIDVNSADFTLRNCYVLMADSGGQATNGITTATAANRMVVEDCEFSSPNAGANEAILLEGTPDGVIIRRNIISGDFAVGTLSNATGNVATNARIYDNYLQNDNNGQEAIDFDSAVTGYAWNNFLVTDAIATAGDFGSMVLADNWYADDGAADAAAVPFPETATTGGSTLPGVVGDLADTAATGAVTTSDTLMAYVKQLVTQNGTELDTDTLGAILVGTGGIATFPAAAHPANAVSLAEVLRSIWARNIAGINPLGTVIFVAASGGNDSNAGTSPNAAKATIASAITAAGAGGTIVLGPGTHNVDVSAAALTPLANQQFISAIPCFGGAPRAVIANDADDGANIVVVDVDGTVWRDIEFRNVTAATTCVTQFSVAQTTAVRGIHFENCTFNQGGLDGAMVSVAMNDATNAVTGAVFKNCRFTGATGTTSVVVYIQVGVGGIARSLIEECVFECQSADGDARAIDFLDPGPGGTSSYGLTVRYCDFLGPTDGGNDAAPISVAAAMTRDEIIPMFRNNFFSQCSATPITQDKFNESIINNYVGDSATGGTLVDPGT